MTKLLSLPARWVSPNRLIALIAAVTIVSVICVYWGTNQAFDAVRTSAQNTVEFEDIRGRIIHLDEVLTQSARMAAVTGDEAWSERYHENVPLLDDALEDATGITSNPRAEQAAHRTRVSNEALVVRELAALHYAGLGRLDEAFDLLTDDFYRHHKDAYADGMREYASVVSAALAQDMAAARRDLRQGIGVAIAALIIIGAAWFGVLLHVNRQAEQLRHTKVRLEKAHRRLAASARQREASIFDDSPLPVFEDDFSAVAPLFVRLRKDGVSDIDAWFDANPVELVSLSRSVAARRVNAAALHLFGVDRALPLQTEKQRFFRHESLDAVRAFVTGLWRGDSEMRQECVVYCADGRALTVLLCARVARGSETTFDTVFTSYVDITALKDAEAQADSANQAKSEFLATMSHEIRTPMNGVLGMAAVLAKSGLTEKQAEMAAIIRQSGDALMEILNDLLDLSKIEAGHFTVEAAPFDIGELIAGVAALMTPRAEEKGLTCSFAVDADTEGRFVGDAARVRQVLTNLLSNAIKFTERGRIAVQVSLNERADGPPHIVVTVADTGIGVAEDKLEHLFDPFVQADSSMTRRFGGTGLGLAICKRLTEMMGGGVAVESTLGEGSTFTFTIAAPRCAGSTEAAPTAVEPVEPDVRALRILAAEDNPNNQMVLRALLDPLEPTLDIVDNGRAAVEAWKAGSYDVVFMDIQMPGVDGVEATREIRRCEAAEGARRTPIIALTANAMSHQVRDYLAAGMDVHVAKPINAEALYGAIKAATAEPEDLAAAASE